MREDCLFFADRDQGFLRIRCPRIAALVCNILDHGNVFTITWQMLPSVLLAFGEVLVATTGLEFAYSQAPLSMKGAIMAFWNIGNNRQSLGAGSKRRCAKLCGHEIHPQPASL